MPHDLDAPPAPGERDGRYQWLLDRVAVGVYRTTPDGRVLEVNDALVAMLGYPDRDSLAAANAADIYVDAADRQAWLEQVEREGVAHRDSIRLRHFDGSMVWVEDIATAVRDEEGRTLHYQGLLLDITERMEAEEALRESESRYRRMVEVSPEAIVVHAEGRILYANPAAVRLAGAERVEDMVGRPALDFVHPDDVPLVARRMQQVLEGGEAVGAVQERLVRIDGTVITTETAAIPVTFEGKQASQVVIRDVTERQRAEDALRESEERFRTSFEHAGIGMAMLSPEGRFLRVNWSLCRMLDRREEDLLARGWQDVVHPDDLERSATLARRALDGEVRSWRIEKRFLRSDWEPIWLLASVTLLTDTEGRPLHFFCQYQDVTERRRAEEALRESEERFRSAFDHAAVGMVMADAETGRFLRVNAAFCELVGYSEDELRSKSWRDITHPEDLGAGDPHRARLQSGEIDNVQIEKRYLHSDGHPVWVLLSLSAVGDPEGRIRYLVGQVHDVTDRKAAEEARERVITILEATSDLVVIVDRGGRALYLNEAARRFVGLADGAAIPSELDLVAHCAPHLGRSLGSAVTEAVREGIWRGELTLRRPSDGIAVPVSLVMIAHAGPGRRVEYFSAIVRDVTERRLAQERLEELIRSKDEFVASVSHELRTPLTAVVGLTQELRDGWDAFPRPEAEELVQVVAEQATEVAHIVEDLLVAARADIGKVTVVPEDLDVADHVAQVLGALGSEARRVRFLGGSARAWADPSRLRQIVRNLATNALRYGGETIEVAVSVQGGQVVVSVRDDGPGVPEADQERIFEPYYRSTEARGQPTSVGLGLTVSRRLAEMMAGELRYRLRDGWSVFELALPASEEESAGGEEAALAGA